MSHNSFGHIFRITTWGESHGAAIGCVVDGVPPQIPLSVDDIQPYLDKRRPAQSRFTTQRKEEDKVEILSGVFEGMTTGASISLVIHNTDQRSKDYSEIATQYRPGHADYTYDAKYGIRDYRGGGRSSARETAVRVAAGAIARKIIASVGIEVRGALVSMGEHGIDRTAWDWRQVDENPFFCPDARAALAWEGYLDGIRKAGSSVGGVAEAVAFGVPAGLGAPLYAKLDADIASGMMSINAVKGVEIGDGFAASTLRGEDNADRMRMKDGKVEFLSNHAGGILGGISSGQEVVVRVAYKPTSSLLIPVESINREGEEIMVQTKGRHDPCVAIRGVPVAEAMLAIVLADHVLLAKAHGKLVMGLPK